MKNDAEERIISRICPFLLKYYPKKCEQGQIDAAVWTWEQTVLQAQKAHRVIKSLTFFGESVEVFKAKIRLYSHNSIVKFIL